MKLEEHIKQNRDAFDRIEQVPSDVMWQKISQPSGKSDNRRSIFRYMIAASVMFAAVTMSIINMNKPDNQEHVAVENEIFSTQENQYYELASAKKETLNYSELDPVEYGEIMSELDQLDSMYADLKLELYNSPDADKVVQTAIKFHERRLQILELLEKEIENQKRTLRDESNTEI